MCLSHFILSQICRKQLFVCSWPHLFALPWGLQLGLGFHRTIQRSTEGGHVSVAKLSESNPNARHDHEDGGLTEDRRRQRHPGKRQRGGAQSNTPHLAVLSVGVCCCTAAFTGPLNRQETASKLTHNAFHLSSDKGSGGGKCDLQSMDFNHLQPEAAAMCL